MTGLERDFLHQLTRIANALEKQNDMQQKTLESLNNQPQEEQNDEPDISELLKKLSKFK